MHIRSRTRTRAVAAATTAVGLGLAGLGVAAPTTASAAPVLQRTDYNFSGGAYGTRVSSGAIGFRSDRTAFSWLPCTTLAGIERERSVAAVNLPSTDDPFIRVRGIESRNFSDRRPGAGIAARATSINRIGSVVLGDDSTPRLTFNAMRTTSRAWATPRGVLKGSNAVASGELDLVNLPDDVPTELQGPLDDLLTAIDGGIDQVLQALQDNAGEITIPGLGVVVMGRERVKVTGDEALAVNDVLLVRLYGPDGADGGGDDSTIRIGHSRARISRGAPLALLSGVAYGASMDLGAGVLGGGRLAEQPLPCDGTEGETITNSLAAFSPPGAEGQFALDGVSGQVFGSLGRGASAKARTAGRLTSLTLGPVRLEGVVGQVNLAQGRRGTITRNDFRGSSIGALYVDGELQGSFDPQTAGQIPALSIPGVADIEFFVGDKGKRRSTMTAVVVRFVPGSPGASELRIGNARASIRRN